MRKSNKMILTIDTSSNKVINVGIDINGKQYQVSRVLDKNKAQVVLPIIDEMMKKYQLSINNLTEIKVNLGPGSFTGLRVGVSIANALGYVLNIPVNGKLGIVEPRY